MMNYLILIYFVVCAFASEKCTPQTDNCGPLEYDFNFSQELSLYSEPNFMGEHEKINITGPFGCTNDVPNFKIKSLLSTGSTQVTLHYGEDCVGHVIKQYQGGSDNIDATGNCPGSIFVKFNRYGSC
ncbi:hypothetical protein Bhyg_08203 [Pseudolycoriella hygida]|uniref:Uncharacterized protein n=1 Tax=Pseudolycoriella hygida TaxID=35572 RepID=A0A9Q0S4P7_9DIPT|nr:hypothetical protein Bhyg_08203 [Pseudolycoriella hygida]